MAQEFQTIDFDHKKGFLRNQPCFSELNDKEISELAAILVEKHLPAGTTIVTEGDLVDSVYLIISGTADVRVHKVVDNKLEAQSVATLKGGDAIGLNENGFYSLSGRRTASVIANTNMVLLRLSVAAFHGFALSNSRVNTIMRKQAQQFTQPQGLHE